MCDPNNKIRPAKTMKIIEQLCLSYNKQTNKLDANNQDQCP